MTLPTRPRPPRARSIVAHGLGLLAGPGVVALLRLLPVVPATPPAWLPLAGLGLVAVLVGAALARWLVAALVGGLLSSAVGAAALSMVLAGALTTLATGATTPPSLPLLAGLAAGSIAWLAALGVHGSLGRVDRSIVGLGAFLAFDAVVAIALFVAWTDRSAPYLAGIAAAGFAAAAALAASRRSSAASALALAASGCVALFAARPMSIEGIVALGPLAAAAALLAAERPATRASGRADIARRLPEVAHDLGEAVLLFDPSGGLVDWNTPAATLLALASDARGARLATILEPVADGATWTTMPSEAGEAIRSRAVLEGDAPRELTLVHGEDGTTLVVIRDLALERNETTESARLTRELRGTIEELLDARRTVDLQRAELERAASVDRLTAVASRRAILDRLTTEVAEARRYPHPVTLVLVDVDGFAALNAEHGVAAGDAVLRELGLRLRLRMRAADALGRLDGDAFAVLLPHTDEAGAVRFAESVLRRVTSRPVMTAAGPISVTLSVGVALMVAGMDVDADGLLAAADEAVASARRGGGNRIAFDRRHGLARIDERRLPEVTWEADLDVS